MTNSGKMELEAKIAIDSVEAIENKLRDLGAAAVGRFTETDAFFDFPDRRFKLADSALRLRDRKNLVTGESSYRMTFKGPCEDSAFKNRREIEFSVDEPTQASALLEAMGVERIVSYTKTRYSWQLMDCDVEVDTLEGIGSFLEVEGQSEQQICEVLAKLGLSAEDSLTESYLAMVIRHSGC